METMTMACVCTEELSSIVLMPSSGAAVFSITTYRTLDDGTELASETNTVTEVLTDEALAAVMALSTAPAIMKVPVKPV